MNSKYDFTLKEGPKVMIENFIGTKSWRKILKGLKRMSFKKIKIITYTTFMNSNNCLWYVLFMSFYI